jgi:hypothetical protein
MRQGGKDTFMSAAEVARHVKPPPRWMIDPRKSTLLGWWDATMGIALIFTAIITPCAPSPLHLPNRMLS